MSMLRHLERCERLDDVVHLHSARTEDDGSSATSSAAWIACIPATDCSCA